MSGAPSLAKPALTLANGVAMPQLGLGVWQSPAGDATANAVRWSLEAGYRHIDTAAIYKNEESVGDGIKAAMAALDIKREDIFLTTKLWNDAQGYESTLAAFEESLKKLQTDYVDLYLIHWPRGDANLAKDGKKYIDTWRAFEKLYAEKKVRAIGVSNFEPKHLEDIFAMCTVKPMVNQIELHPLNQQHELREFCSKHNIAITCWSPLGQGKLIDDATIGAIAAAHKRTTAQVMLRWEIQLGLITIPKSINEDRIKQNCAVFDFTLSEAHMATLNGMNQNERYGPKPTEAEF